ncbi:MAG: RnfABCDGE type electron transport complex subunit D [Candidatus Omnitrophica bacterium]|nr:RnfABCDGE type electron transport complex subunit D [Candidatus Omnitrophota bacterium]MBD3268942.1 RnfABCDGE type electron transport complex subunit D [Candidatus Omnitrophota bacterium]
MPLQISSSPHLKAKADTPFVMLQVVVALIPATAASIYFFRQRAVFLIAVCISVSLLTEHIIYRIRRKPSTLGDWSAVVTGLLLALTLPPATKWYAAILGTLFAILVGKHLFGGLGTNIFNPALIGRAFLMAAYPKMMTTFTEPFSVDTVTSATPLSLQKFSASLTPLKELFIGNVAGSLGETSALCIIAGGLYLLIRKIADWRIPLSLLGSVIIVSLIAQFLNQANASVLFHLLSGGLLLGTFFMATDPVTTPISQKGRYIFGAGCGVLIMVIRYFSGLPEGVMYSILFFNSLTPLINRYTPRHPFGR